MPMPVRIPDVADRLPDFPPRPLPEDWKNILREHHRFDLGRVVDWRDRFEVLPLLKHRIPILIVVDTGIGFSNDPDAGFELGMVLDALRENFNPCYFFDIHLAQRGTSTFTEVASPGPYQAKYLNFKFDARDASGNPILNRYEQVWCFGLAPGNAPTGQAFTDAQVNSHTLRATESELAVLARWMDERDGGVFATGDHAHLGAVMSARIPRVGTMRKWMIADNPPTFVGPDRFDTNQPKTRGDTATTILNDNQTDEFPQPVKLVPERIIFESVLKTRFEPHPIMCAGKLGAVNVFPDHQHEGQIVEDANVVVGNTVSFSGVDAAGNTNSYSAAEYPNAGGSQTRPRIIARAGPVTTPPYTFQKGTHSTGAFGMVGIYDGHKEGVGRVVVDSTWHHWLNMNLRGLAADTSSTNYAKIKTYFRNIGLWLSNRLSHRRIYSNVLWNAHLTYEATQEIGFSRKWWVDGPAIESIITKWASPCQVTQWNIDFFTPPDLVLELPFEIPEPCLSCPPIDFIKWSIFTEISANFREPLAKVEEALLAARNSEKAPKVEVSEKEIDALFVRGAAAGLKTAAESLQKSLERGRKAVDLLAKGVGSVQR
jgi:hypothetical protein